MSQAYRSLSYYLSPAAEDGATGHLLTEGAGWAADDILIAFTTVVSATSITIPSGWTNIATSLTGTLAYSVSWIKRGASAPTNRTWTWAAGGNRFMEMHVASFSGCDPAGPVAASALGSAGSGSNHNPAPPQLAGGTARLYVIGGAFRESSGVWAAGSGYTMRSDITAGNSICMASRAADALDSGTVTPPAFTGAAGGTSDFWDGFTIALAGVSAAPGPLADTIIATELRPFNMMRGRM